jgi:hypothetical protein
VTQVSQGCWRRKRRLRVWLTDWSRTSIRTLTISLDVTQAGRPQQSVTKRRCGRKLTSTPAGNGILLYYITIPAVGLSQTVGFDAKSMSTIENPHSQGHEVMNETQYETHTNFFSAPGELARCYRDRVLHTGRGPTRAIKPVHQDFFRRSKIECIK